MSAEACQGQTTMAMFGYWGSLDFDGLLLTMCLKPAATAADGESCDGTGWGESLLGLFSGTEMCWSRTGGIPVKFP